MMLARLRRHWPLLLLFAGALPLTGCIRKMATITSNPPGARCWMNGVYQGTTPVEIPYNWNWYYDFKLEAPGYQTMTCRERFYAPASHYIPVDLVAEVAPWRSKEPQWRHYNLQPAGEP